jgi:hypothetical protein
MIRRYVADGGHVIVMGETSLYDAAGTPRPDFALADVLGVSFLGTHQDYRDFNYFARTGTDQLFAGIDIPLLPAPAVGLDVRVLDVAQPPSAVSRAAAFPGRPPPPPPPAGGAAHGPPATQINGDCPYLEPEVVARFLAKLPGRYVPLGGQTTPAIVRHRYGKGSSLYLAGTFGEMAMQFAPPEYRTLLANACHLASEGPVQLHGGLGNVEMVVRRQAAPGPAGRRLIVHLVNYAGIPPRPFERIAPQRGLRLLIPDAGKLGRARALRMGMPCPAMRTPEGQLVIDLPQLQEYEVILVE